MKRTADISITDRLASLSDPVRLRLLRMVEGQELSVGEVARVLQLPQSTVSRHLKTLAAAGWVARRNEGTASLYRLVADELSPAARSIWAAVREQTPLARDDAQRLRAVLAERRTDSQAFFGKHAGEWDDLRQTLFGGRFTALSLLGLIRRDWIIADLGCGTGNAAELLAPHVARVLAVDLSIPMLQAARKRLAGVENVEFVNAPADRTGLPPHSVDACVCVLVLHHLDEPAKALREMRRLLRPDRGGGTVLVVDMAAHDRDEYRRLMGHKHLGFSKDAMLTMMHDAGLVDGVYHDLPPEPDGKGPGLFVATARLPATIND
ncbi:MAG: transcriptional regulator [Phycisphaerae bacterium]|nr:MAG: transcriptional regulator [Phycisphaerae bacterium]